MDKKQIKLLSIDERISQTGNNSTLYFSVDGEKLSFGVHDETLYELLEDFGKSLVRPEPVEQIH